MSERKDSDGLTLAQRALKARAAMMGAVDENRTNPDIAMATNGNGAGEEEFVETWTCDRCSERGELTFDRGTSHIDYRAAMLRDHHKKSPSCRSRVVRSKLYDPDRQTVLTGPRRGEHS